MNRRLGAPLYLNREYDAAIAQLQRAAEMANLPGSIDGFLSNIYEEEGERDLAVEDEVRVLQDVKPQIHAETLLAIYRKQGWQVRTRILLVAPPTSCTPYQLRVDDLHGGEFDHAFESFRRAI